MTTNGTGGRNCVAAGDSLAARLVLDPSLALEAIARFAARLDREDYKALVEECSALRLARCGRGAPCFPNLPAWDAYRVFANQVLTAGLPTSAVPVESLHRPWHDGAQGKGEGPHTVFSAQVGFYMGEAAVDARAVLDELGVETPESFRATPDHISLLIEAALLLWEKGDSGKFHAFAHEHFAWFDAYADRLDERASRISATAKPALAAWADMVAAIPGFIAVLDGAAKA